MILSRFCLLILCFGICLAVDTSDAQPSEASDESMIINLIYGCFEDRGEDVAPCDLYQKQIACLKPHSEDQFVKELLEGLDSTVRIYGCPLEENLDNVVEEETVVVEDEIESENSHHNRERRLTRHPCLLYRHPHMDDACLNWLYENYHTLNPGWEPCPNLTYNFTKPCGWYWAKCKRAKRNHHCCMSIKCHSNN